jgi:hypothetical protein
MVYSRQDLTWQINCYLSDQLKYRPHFVPYPDCLGYNIALPCLKNNTAPLTIYEISAFTNSILAKTILLILDSMLLYFLASIQKLCSSKKMSK